MGPMLLPNLTESQFGLARLQADIQATVAFAAANNLRLVVKNTGHDWFSRSTAGGSLLLWTHLRKGASLRRHQHRREEGRPD